MRRVRGARQCAVRLGEPGAFPAPPTRHRAVCGSLATGHCGPDRRLVLEESHSRLTHAVGPALQAVLCERAHHRLHLWVLAEVPLVRGCQLHLRQTTCEFGNASHWVRLRGWAPHASAAATTIVLMQGRAPPRHEATTRLAWSHWPRLRQRAHLCLAWNQREAAMTSEAGRTCRMRQQPAQRRPQQGNSVTPRRTRHCRATQPRFHCAPP